MSCRSRCPSTDAPTRARRTAGDAGGLPARAVRPDRHPPRLRARCVRRLHGAGGRTGGALLPDLRRAGRRQEVTTVEGIASPDGELSPVQAALKECHGLQCGFCTPGFVTSITALLRDNPKPTDEEIREGLSGNFCRCTGYQGIVNAVHRAAETM